MKPIASALAAHYATGSTTVAFCLRIQRTDGQVYRFTSWDRDVTVVGENYLSAPGLDISGIAFSVGLAPDNLELRVLYASDAITRADLLAGRWSGAAFSLFEVNARDTSGGINLLLTGETGEAKLTDGEGFTIELRSLKQALQRPCGSITQKTCRARLGDSRCGVDLADHTAADTVGTVYAARRLFSGTSVFAPDGAFQAGELTFTSGPNAGVVREIKTFFGGIYELALPMPFDIEPGHAFSAVAGCQGRLEQDCRDRFDNVLNFQGEPHLVGTDALTATPTPGE